MNRLVLVSLFAFAGCRSIDPDKGIFTCTTSDDCASANLECRPQFSGPGRCFTVGTCADVELCNGVDDTCDGRIDESFPEENAACQASQRGVCAEGKKVCRVGTVSCESQRMPSIELCNGLDDDCNGTTDETFDLTTNAAHCGACNRPCAAGTLCRASACIETRCDDGVDNDQNGRADCDDERCFGLVCSTIQAPSSQCGFAPVIPDAGQADAGTTDGGELDGGMEIDAGIDAGSIDAGSIDGGYLRGCFRPEFACDDGFDNDGDGVADCGDPDCDGRTCFSGQACSQRTCPGPG